MQGTTSQAWPASSTGNEPDIEKKKNGQKVIRDSNGDRRSNETPFKLLDNNVSKAGSDRTRSSKEGRITQTKSQFIKAFKGAQINRT